MSQDKKDIILEVIKLIENADSEMIIDGKEYRNPRQYTIDVIKKYYSI